MDITITKETILTKIMKKSKIYTRGGDTGTTSLIGGQRVKKCCLRLDSYGTIDELNSHLGLLATMLDGTDVDLPTQFLQSCLFEIGTHLAMPCEGDAPVLYDISEACVEQLEQLIDELDQQLEPLRSFILPGGSMAAAQCHVCRTVCRRAERYITALSEESPLSPTVLAFVNRLSDFFFVLARLINKKSGITEISWQKSCT